MTVLPMTAGTEALAERQVFCPKHFVGDQLDERFPIVLAGESDVLVGCKALQVFRRTGGCQWGGCCFLAPHSIKTCPFEKTGHVDIKAVMSRNGKVAAPTEPGGSST
jgi:hypothetical protein